MAGPWTKPATWRQDVRISATEISAEGGYMNAAVLIEGCRTVDGHTPSALENGTYLLQAPSVRYDEAREVYFLGKSRLGKQKPTHPSQIPVEHCHYVLTSSVLDPETNLPLRRHLKFNPKEQKWQISPLCDSFEEVTCISMGASFDGGWCQRMKTLAEPAEFQAGRHAGRRGQANGEEDEGHEEQEEEADDEDEDDETFFIAPLPWNDSAHQAALLGQDRIQLLGLRGDQMAEELHPELRSFFEQNGVEIGDALDRVRANHAEVLSLITGTRRSRKSANTVLGGEFHLTGDAILKMHAIHSRLACGIPVVLSGECGCGKTFVIRYLAEWLRADLLVLNVHGGTSAAEIVAILDRAEALLLEDDRTAKEATDELLPDGAKDGLQSAPPTLDAVEPDADHPADKTAEEDGIEEPDVPEPPVPRGTRQVFVFFDELNACAHVAIM
eukprot:4669678-Prymnesium_polylepis.1